MNQMEIFKNPEFGSIRVIEENGKYLFSGTDVAAALGYSNPRDAIIRHCRYVVKRDAPHPQSLDRKISMTFIPEGDLYRLIVHSKLPSAERFERWVFDEVLPTIRKHGAYLTKEKLWEVATSPEALIRDREFERLSAENGAGWLCGQAGTAGAEGVGLPDAPKQQQLEPADPQST